MFSQNSKVNRILLSLLLSSSFAVIQCEEGQAEAYKPVSSNNIYQGKKNSHIYVMQSQLAMRSEKYDAALKLAKRAVDLDRDDIDARVAYGEALYKIWQRDPSDKMVYNKCVKAWLIVHRNVLGHESGTALKGISLPLGNKFFEDENHGILAKRRLKTLVGRLPKFWESNSKYLKKVLIPIQEVQGSVVSSQESTDENESKSESSSTTNM